MRLLRLTAFGFKSFAEKVEVTFEPGVTAIVGPNGCGKSNLSDAIRWALGEQSAKLLRGDRMDDLIFAGNSVRKPLGMAEVSLIFTDNYGNIPTEFHEVTVTRRLYRSGESEYLLNHVPCRLRDITDLFLDTGLGGEPYALIEQGSIGSIVSAKPAERRLLIEEAAGIMTYKVRKRSALAKLEAAEQNLLRVSDIIREVERQKNSLKRQANKAERYRAYQDRARELKGFVKYSELQQVQQQLTLLQNAALTAQNEVDSAQTVVAAVEAEQEAIRIRELEQEQERAAAIQRLHELKSCLSRDEAELNHLGQMLNESTLRKQERRDRSAHLQGRRTVLVQQEAEATEQKQALDAELLTGRAQLDLKSSELHALEERIATAARALEATRRRLAQDAVTLADRRNHLISLRERARLYTTQRDLAIQRKARLEQQDLDLVPVEEAQGAVLAQVIERLDALHTEREALTRQTADEETARETNKAQLEGLRDESAKLSSRLASLIELSQSFEGYADGHRYLLKQKAQGEARVEGLKGSLADLLEVPARYERAIETLLGDALQGLVMQRAEDVQEAIRLLIERGQGRATFLLQREALSGQNETPTTRHREILGRYAQPPTPSPLSVEGLAIDLIRCADGDRPLVEALLADGIVVGELSDALALSNLLPSPFAIATLTGELVTSRGIIAGGPGGGSGILPRRREIARLRDRVRELHGSLQTVEASWEASCRRSAHFMESLELLNQRLHELEIERLKAETAFAHTGAERRRFLQQIEVLTYEVGSHEEDLRVLAGEIGAIEHTLVELEGQDRVMQLEAVKHETDAAARQQERDGLIMEVGEYRVQLTALQGQREILTRSLVMTVEELSQVKSELESLEAELAAQHLRETTMETAVATLQERLTSLVEEEQSAQRIVVIQDEARQELSARRQSIDERLRMLKQSLVDKQQALNDAAIRLAELRNAISFLEEALREEAPPELEAIVLRLTGSGLGIDAANDELADLTTRIAELGAVNMAALEEYQELAERHQFLSTQTDDLSSSVQSLRTAISEINDTIQQRFNDTLQTVAGHLDRLWSCLIPGGQASLSLTQLEDGEEEPGVEMAVRIPGKRAALNLLSGGEKALAALSLLLALFHTRPSPFCLLDEVDAPLDDANAERFASLLKEMAASAQFLLITHNKRTMSAADLLYGVTMEEHGVSKLLSLHMNRAA
ncbi:MAG: chromosome segregation protein SMC [Candidatus Methylomirabilis oxygeniifera]|uniref:Chromosome partition protein Smc n=1 Tax=Methylomirabilis oxygeniifera TaxID=671143 RepID=D5MFF3_METO1|nr:MAG: chromosome segregation protein SMC [Candidatus Methylomirabilis oxyfera]CBE68484.1 putative Chromosome partition protein smc [Candidatus Methylomirabilis oxyfera]